MKFLEEVECGIVWNKTEASWPLFQLENMQEALLNLD